jgi:outer membrane lipoprotein carrier protein
MHLFKHLYTIITIVLLSSFALPVYGADLTAVIATLEQGYNSLEDMQADFSQRTAIASMKREEHGKGELFIKKAGQGQAMFRFNYTTPRQQIVSNGKKVWYYLPENKQVMVSDVTALFAGGNGIALNYLTGMGHVSRDFTITFDGEGRDKKGNYVLDLVPKKPNQVMTRLRLTIAASAVEQFRESGKPMAMFPIVSSVVDDPFGNRTFFEFSRVKVNQGMGNDRFVFKIPKGVEVIKN